MAYDASRGRVVLYGGSESFGGSGRSLTDMWEHDGGQWIEVQSLAVASSYFGPDAFYRKVLKAAMSSPFGPDIRRLNNQRL